MTTKLKDESYAAPSKYSDARPDLMQNDVSQGRVNSSGYRDVGELDICFTVEDAIDTIGFGKFQLGLVCYTGMSWLADAMEMILLSYIGPAARCEFGLSGQQEAFISSVVFLGILVGSYAWGTLSDIKGRRPGYFATAVFTLIFGLLSAWSPTYWILLVCRTLVGFGLGGASVVFSLCSEFLPSANRGFWLVFIEFFWTVGSVAEALLAWAIIPHLSWRWLVLISAVPFLLMLLFYPLLPESPRFLMVKGDVEGALAVLRRVALVNNTLLPPGTLSYNKPSAVLPAVIGPLAKSTGAAVVTPGAHTLRPASAAPKLVPIQPTLPQLTRNKSGASSSAREYRAAAKRHKNSVVRLLSPTLRRTTLLLWLVFFANAYTYYGQVLLTTQLAVSDGPSGASAAQRCASSAPPQAGVPHVHRGLLATLSQADVASSLLRHLAGPRRLNLQPALQSAGSRKIPEGHNERRERLSTEGRSSLTGRRLLQVSSRQVSTSPGWGKWTAGFYSPAHSRQSSDYVARLELSDHLAPKLQLNRFDLTSPVLSPIEPQRTWGMVDPANSTALLTLPVPNGRVLLSRQGSGEDTSGCAPGGRPDIADSQYFGVVVTSCAELPGLVAALLIVDRFGRKGALTSLLFLSGLFLLPLLAELPQGITTTLLFAARACIMGAFSVLWAYAPEIYPTDVRTTGVGVANAWSRLGGFICPFIAIDLLASCRRVLVVGLFVVVPMAAGAASMFFPLETKGRALVEESDPDKDDEALLPLTRDWQT